MRFIQQSAQSITRVLLLLSLTVAIPGTLFGQEGESDQEDEDLIEEVIITGSRLIRSNLDSPSPVTIFDAQQLKDTGVTTLGEFARYLPQNADIASDASNTGTQFRGSGAFNLRGIGLDGTLTLVNGRRIAPFGSSGDFSPFVDINSIPLAAIERIEILKDGASAIYGSEAVAGVVNIITRKKFTGVVLEGGYMTPTEGDGHEWDINFTGGWSNDTTNFTGTLSYFRRDLIWARDRDFSSDVDFSDRGGYNNRSSMSSPPTITLLETGALLADPECPEQTKINSHNVIFPGEVEFCRFNWAQFVTMQNPSDRFGLTAYVDHEFTGGTTLFAEVLYSRNKTEGVMAPTPLFNFFVPDFHPNNTYGENLLIRFRSLDTGDRGFITKVTSWRALAGVRGAFTNSEWDWEAALMASESESDDSAFNATLIDEFQDALFGLGGPNGDQFYNPFGLNTVNPQEVVDQFLISGIGTLQINKEYTADIQVTGNFGNLGGGPIGAAFGVQARKQKLNQSASAQELAGNIAGGGGLTPINEKRDIYSVFAEFLLPVHEKFEVQLAVRYDDYNDSGSTTNPKVGLGWRPVEELLLRATWGTSFRPPAFRYLHAPKTEGPGFVFFDPHRCPVTGDFFDCNGRVVEAEFQGNPELQPDEGETMLFGVAWEPASVEGLALSLDFWQIKHKNRVFQSDDFFVADQLMEMLDPFTNPFVIRAPQTPEDVALGIPGIIVKTSDTYVNGDTLKTNGIDFDLSYTLNTENSGIFSTSFNYTYLHDYLFGTDFQEAVFTDNLAGWYAYNSGLPQHRFNLSFAWNRNAHGIAVLIPYAGKFDSWQNVVVDGQQTDSRFTIDDYWQLDLQYNYVFSSLRDAKLSVGCRNCTDKDPPVYNQTSFTEPFHEGRGAMVYLRWSQPF